MDGIKEYLFGAISAAILCGLISQMAPKESFIGAAIKLITGIFMVFALVSPIFKLQISAPAKIINNITSQAEQITSSATDSTRESISEIISDRLQAYILDKANDHGVTLTADIILSNDEIPKPVSVSLCGNVSPFTKKILSAMIEEELGIGTEAQIWN